MIEVNIKDNESLEKLRRFNMGTLCIKTLKESLNKKPSVTRELPKNKPLEEQLDYKSLITNSPNSSSI